MASEKISDFLILNHTKMSEFSPDMNTKMRELMVFSFLSQTSSYSPPFSQQKNQVQLQPGNDSLRLELLAGLWVPLF